MTDMPDPSDAPQPEVKADRFGLGPDGWPAKPEYIHPRRDSDGVPLAKEKRKHHWRKTERLTFGETLLDTLDPNRRILSHEQHLEIVAIRNGGELAKLLSIDLADTKNPDLAKAYEVFGQLESREIQIPRIMLCLNFYTIAQCMLVIEDNRTLVNNAKLEGADRASAHRCSLEAVVRLKQLVEITGKLAKEYLKERKDSRAKPKKQTAPAVAPSLD